MKFINKILPSSKLKTDIDIKYNKINTIKPISIKELSLISPVKKNIFKLRNKNSTINIEKINSGKMSLIIPYRHREENLKEFIPYMHTYLQKQNIDYEIIIVEQEDNKPFNKAKLMNIGAKYSRDESNYFVFHDVDLLPENIDYNYCNHTQKLFTFIKEDGIYKQYSQQIFGGAILVPKKIFFKINGFSNNYWQWGKEDDDFLIRHLYKGFVPLFDYEGKFKSLTHHHSLTRDNDGKHTKNKSILAQNEKLYKINKNTFSKFKRGLTSQEEDGIDTINNYTILKIKENQNVKTVLVSFQTTK